MTENFKLPELTHLSWNIEVANLFVVSICSKHSSIQVGERPGGMDNSMHFAEVGEGNESAV